MSKMSKVDILKKGELWHVRRCKSVAFDNEDSAKLYAALVESGIWQKCLCALRADGIKVAVRLIRLSDRSSGKNYCIQAEIRIAFPDGKRFRVKNPETITIPHFITGGDPKKIGIAAIGAIASGIRAIAEETPELDEPFGVLDARLALVLDERYAAFKAAAQKFDYAAIERLEDELLLGC